MNPKSGRGKSRIGELEAHLTDQPYVHTFSSQLYGTSTLVRTVKEETRRAQSTNTRYNADLDPCQHPIFKSRATDISDPYFREKLFKASPFLRVHTVDLLEDIMKNGWKMVNNGVDIDKLRELNKMDVTKKIADDAIAHSVMPIAEAIQHEIDGMKVSGELDYDPAEDENNLHPQSRDAEWSYNLQRAFIDAFAKSMVIDSGFITRFDHESALVDEPYSYKVFTRNNVYRIYGNKQREITEVYFQYPSSSNFYYEEENMPFETQYVGFLTQYSKVDKREPSIHMKRGFEKTRLWDDKEITRNCIVIQPVPCIEDPYGQPYLYREEQTALEKLYLRFYEMLFLYKGGTNKTVAFQDGASKTLKDYIVRETGRGIQSRGTVISSTASTKPVGDMVFVAESQIPDLKFDTINSHLSEDAQLTKQGVEGEAASGALGGQAPVINKSEDKDVKEALYPIIEQYIKHINYVFFDIDPLSYKVYFKSEYDPIDKDRLSILQSANQNKQIQQDKQQKPENPIDNSWMWGNPIDIEAHSIVDDFDVYVGNMFKAGTYEYPEKGYARTYSADDIKRLTQRNVREGYLEIDHSMNDVGVGLSEGIGYYRIEGYDEKNQSDVTKFYINKKYSHLVDPKLIKVSPFFHVSESKGKKEIFVKNCAIVKTGIPRGELTGLKTEAWRN